MATGWKWSASAFKLLWTRFTIRQQIWSARSWKSVNCWFDDFSISHRVEVLLIVFCYVWLVYQIERTLLCWNPFKWIHFKKGIWCLLKWFSHIPGNRLVQLGHPSNELTVKSNVIWWLFRWHFLSQKSLSAICWKFFFVPWRVDLMVERTWARWWLFWNVNNHRDRKSNLKINHEISSLLRISKQSELRWHERSTALIAAMNEILLFAISFNCLRGFDWVGAQISTV